MTSSDPPRDRPIVLLLGPTAGGKTALSIALAQRLPGGGACIGCDSMQVYRGMDVGTAKPTAEELAAAPHHLFDVADPSEDGFTVDTWLELAERAIADVRSRGRWPIVVGGTNLYVQALLFGLFDGPEPDEALRAELTALSDRDRRRRLEEVDPVAASRIHPNDLKRTLRALEVHAKTGRPLSELQREWEGNPPRADVRIVGLDWPVEPINRRINARVKAMFEAGLVEETRRLLAAPGGLGRQAREALGYKQVIDHLEGRCTLDEAIEQVKIRTRRYAKQQRTWLRRFRGLPGGIWLEAGDSKPETIARQALDRLDTGTLGAEVG